MSLPIVGKHNVLQHGSSLLASSWYFAGLCFEMEQLGFQPLSRVTVDSFQTPHLNNWYYYVRSTRLFFNLPGTSLIVMFSYTESLGNESRSIEPAPLDQLLARTAWEMQIWLTADEETFVWIQSMITSPHFVRQESETRTLVKQPILVLQYQLKDTKFGYNERNQRNSIEEVVEPLRSFVPAVRQFLLPKYDTPLAFDFAPVSDFPVSSQIFWKHFQTAPLHKLVETSRPNGE